MIIPTSPEYLDLCRSQALVLRETLGVTSTAIYLAEHRADQSDPALIPVFAFPEPAELEQPVKRSPKTSNHLSTASDSVEIAPQTAAETDSANNSILGLDEGWSLGFSADATANQSMVLPMAYEEVLLGVLVCYRPTPWQESERQQAKYIADSLAIACVLDQRGQWMQQQLKQKYLDQEQQSERFHDLLHQFRNPLTAMRTFGKLLTRRLQSGDTNYPIAEGIVRESDRLEGLVEQFDMTVASGDRSLAKAPIIPSTESLALPPAQNSSLEDQPASQLTPHQSLTGQLSMELATVDEILEPVLVSAGAVAQERQIRIAQGLVEELPPVFMDRSALREVLSNLIDNALKYSPARSWIWVATGLLKQKGNSSEPYQGIAVGDTGPGIPQEDQSRVFERSYRGVQAEGEIPGTGLGLAIAKDLVVAMGGSIELYSPASLSGLVPTTEADGNNPGSVFIVWLRQAQPNNSLSS